MDDNDQLSEYLRRTDLAQIIENGERSLEKQFWNPYAYHFSRGAADWVAGAIKVLDERFQLVGITEDLPQTVALLCADLGVPIGAGIPHERPTAFRIRQAELDAAQIAKLRRLMELDYRVYRHALAVFRQRAAGNRGDEAAGPGHGAPQPAPEASPPASAEPELVTLRRAEVCGTLSMSSRPARGEQIDIGCEVAATVDRQRLDFAVRIYNDLQLLLYDERFPGVAEGLRVGEGCELGITVPSILGLGYHFVDLLLYIQRAAEPAEIVEFRRACDFVVERSPEITSAGLVALAATPYVRRSAGDMGGYGARLSVLHQPPRLPSGTTATAQLALLNDGAKPLEVFGVHRVALGYHIRDMRTGENLAEEMPRTGLGADIASGGRVLLEARLTAPKAPGTYIVEWDLVREWVAWFGLSCTAVLEVTGA